MLGTCRLERAQGLWARGCSSGAHTGQRAGRWPSTRGRLGLQPWHPIWPPKAKFLKSLSHSKYDPTPPKKAQSPKADTQGSNWRKTGGGSPGFSTPPSAAREVVSRAPHPFAELRGCEVWVQVGLGFFWLDTPHAQAPAPPLSPQHQDTPRATITWTLSSGFVPNCIRKEPAGPQGPAPPPSLLRDTP